MTGLFTISFFTPLYYFFLSKSVQHCQNNTKKTVKIDKNVCRKSWKSEKIGQKKRKILLHCVSFDKLYLNLSVSLVFEKDDNNSQFPIVGKNQRTVKTLSKKKYTHMTQFNNSVWKFYFKYTSTCNFIHITITPNS